MKGKKLLVANWKMNPATYEEAKKLTDGVLHAVGGKTDRVVLCPPFPWLTDLSQKIKTVKWGAQDVFWKETGAFTGEVSPSMLKNSGVSYVIVGHSERRKFLNETDRMINEKIKASLDVGLIPILCVGEWTKGTFDKAKEFIEGQLRKDLKGTRGTLLITYEPVWAISTSGNGADTPENAGKIIRHIKKFLDSNLQFINAKLLYGGSVDSNSIAGFMDDPMIDGFLIGRASLIPQEMDKMYTMSITN